MIAAFVAAEAGFPRGPGFYFSIVKLVLVLIVYLAWVKACAWVNEDAIRQRLHAPTWNALVVGCGLAGLLILWVLPVFWFSMFMLLALILTGVLSYVYQRDQRVPEKRRILPWGPSDEAEATPTLIRFLDKGKGKKQRKQAAETNELRTALVLVYNAVFQHASEIVLEASPEAVTVAYRLAGDLQPVDPLPRPDGDAVVDLITTLAGITASDNGESKRGRFTAEVDGRLVDLSVTAAGKSLAIRILDRARKVLALDQLGFCDDLIATITPLLERPGGLIIVTSPPGAGKTTTLYGFLGAIDRIQRTVAIIDNHVELPLPNATQVELHGQEGKTFSTEFRGVIRGGKKVVALGDLPTAEIASIAGQAAQKERLILAALPAGDAVAALVRLREMGVPSPVVAGAVTAVVGQRLVRLLCSHCKAAYQPNPEVLRQAKLPASEVEHFYRPPDVNPAGPVCEHCGGTGYHDRVGIFEVLVVNDAIRQLIKEKAAPDKIRQAAEKNGMKSLQDDGLRQVVEGNTSIQELLRVCQ